MLKLITLMSLLMSAASAFAADPIPLLRVTAEAYPGEEYFIGIYMDANNNVTGIYYEDRFVSDPKDVMHPFDMKDLVKGVVLKKKDKYELIKMKMTQESTGVYAVDLDFMTNGMFNYRGHAYLTLKRAKNNSYQVFYQGDTENASDVQLINNAYIATRYIPLTKKQLGIARIDFSFR